MIGLPHILWDVSRLLKLDPEINTTIWSPTRIGSRTPALPYISK